jgi:maltooligosyltrehalose trehalohydrolase
MKMTTRRHHMPYGAELTDDGTVRFRLWAPAARQVELCLHRGGDEQLIPLAHQEAGWYELITREAGAGDRYRFRIDGGMRVPDPASRFQPADVHDPSEIIDPAAFQWTDQDWRGRPWEETVLYELHTGTFTPAGTFRGIEDRLDYLADLGITAVELMPVSDFPGRRNWGYDGVLPFAPDSAYGRPEDLKHLIQAAHRKGLMVFLDVVYNHFGPEGNYLHVYAEPFFTERHHTPWGAGINFDGERSRDVRDFFIHNALYWLEEYHLDGLRLDAVHAIADDSRPDILQELAARVQAGPARGRHVHLVLENDHNAARYLDRGDDGAPRFYVAQWNDDAHHALHLLATGETDGYYEDYADAPLRHLGRVLTEGFAYQGDPSAYRQGERRGEPSGHLPLTAFVNLLQNHDQVGNRALGERIDRLARPDALRAVTAVLLLAPSPPLLFMGQELAAPEPFLFFCDFGEDLAQSVTEGRRREFARFERFSDPEAQRRIPDPNDPDTFEKSRLDWTSLERDPHRGWLALHRELLALRRREIVPRLAQLRGGQAGYEILGERGLLARWRLGDDSRLTLLANLGEGELAVDEKAANLPSAEPLYAEPATLAAAGIPDRVPAWSVIWWLQASPA